MADPYLAQAHVRRFEGERDEPWREEALEIAHSFAKLVAEAPPEARDRAQELLVAASQLPAREGDADSLRRSLLNWVIDTAGEESPSTPELFPGALIVDPYGSLAIAVQPAASPPPDWQRAQTSQRVREVGDDAQWWKALTFGGGAVEVPDECVFAAGRPTDDQLWELVERTGHHAIRTLAELHPRLVAQARERSK